MPPAHPRLPSCPLLFLSAACRPAGDSALDTGGSIPERQPPLELFSDPCEGRGSPLLLGLSPAELLVGCDQEAGLWRSVNGGDTFARAHPSEALAVFALARGARGELWMCGQEADRAVGGVQRGRPGGTWQPLSGGSPPGAPLPRLDGPLARCGDLRIEGDRVVAAGLDRGQLALSEDGGHSWRELAVPGGGTGVLSSSPHLMQLDGEILDVGPLLSSSSPTDGSAVRPLPELEAWALATPDRGRSWFAGGRARVDGRGMLVRATASGERSEQPLPSDRSVVRQIAFSEDGRVGLAVGHRGDSSAGGFALLSADGGHSWTALPSFLPPLDSATLVGRTYWLAGDDFLARGRL